MLALLAILISYLQCLCLKKINNNLTAFTSSQGQIELDGMSTGNLQDQKGFLILSMESILYQSN